MASDKPLTIITQERLKYWLTYNPELGQFYWNNAPRQGIKKGSIAGAAKSGYCHIGLEKISYSAHRLAWLYMTGRWPTDEIDHIDGDGFNNKWSNLREATRSQNQANRQFQDIAGFTLIGKNHYRVKIGHQVLGTFSSEKEARAVYLKARKERYGEFNPDHILREKP
jgi:hypothetical protein